MKSNVVECKYYNRSVIQALRPIYLTSPLGFGAATLGLHGVRSVVRNMANSSSHIPIPSALKFKTSCTTADWKRFKGQWENYEVATDLADKTMKKRAAVFLACIGTEAYELYQTMEFDDDDELDLKKIMDAFEKHYIGDVNITYERYNFNQRKQEIGESFDVFVVDLRRLARSCDYGVVEESMIRDRIV
jgi:hypothetical protein